MPRDARLTSRPLPPGSEQPVRTEAAKPWPVTAAMYALGAVVAGLVMWTVYVVADVQRLRREAATLSDRFDGGEGTFFYSLYSLVCVAVLIGLGLLTAAATGWLMRRGRRASLFVTCTFLAVMVVLCGLPSSFVAAVLALSGSSQRQVTDDMAFDDALTVVHTANTPGWTTVVALLASAFIVVGSLAALVLLLLPASRRYFTTPAATRDQSPETSLPPSLTGQPG